MKRSLIAFQVIGMLSMASCTSGTEKPGMAETTVLSDSKAVANTELALEVSGMVCKMGCGGAIRKELKATGAVTDCSFDFEEEREWNTAKISFDNNRISAGEIVKIVTRINDGQFKAGKQNTSEIASAEQETKSSGSGAAGESARENAGLEMTKQGFEMPNLLDLFSGLLP